MADVSMENVEGKVFETRSERLRRREERKLDIGSQEKAEADELQRKADEKLQRKADADKKKAMLQEKRLVATKLRDITDFPLACCLEGSEIQLVGVTLGEGGFGKVGS